MLRLRRECFAQHAQAAQRACVYGMFEGQAFWVEKRFFDDRLSQIAEPVEDLVLRSVLISVDLWLIVSYYSTDGGQAEAYLLVPAVRGQAEA